MAKELKKNDKVSELTIGEVQSMLTDTMVGAVSGVHDNCPIPCSAKPHIPAVMNMIKDVDGGDLERGIEQLRHNHEFTTELRKTFKTLSQRALFLLFTAVLVGVGGAFWLGIKAFLIKNPPA